MYKLGIITSSDKGYSGERKDESGLVIACLLYTSNTINTQARGKL